MKVCPQCNSNYEDSMFFCLEDGTPLRSPNDVNLEQTLAMPKIDQQTVELPASGQKTLALPDQPTGEKSIETETWETETSPPKPIPLVQTAENIRKPPVTTAIDSTRPGGKGIFILLGTVLGVVVLVGAGALGWWLSQPSKDDVLVKNSNRENLNTNINSNSSNINNSGSSGAGNDNISNENTTPSPNTNGDKPTPKVSPTKDKSPTPTPKETPTETPTPKTPTPTPTLTPTPTPTPDRTPPAVISAGFLNNRATILYQPRYPPAAKAAGIGGRVNVQVLVNENGRVVNAVAVSGHPLLRAASEEAARNAKFSPPTVDGQPVKMRGVLSFNFVP